jgi:pseudaminic acid cytidylyltransferase
MPNALCIIPARGGSKRIPKKNIKEFHGRPIISYSIETALQSGLFEEVMVSTDCEEIRRVSIDYGAKVPFLRSQENSDDYATTIDVVNEVLEIYQSKGSFYSRICVLYPCAPFVKSSDLIRGNKTLDNYESVIPIVAFDFPPLRSFVIRESNLNYNWPEFEKTRSQDLEKLYHDAGQWYFIKHYGNKHGSLIKKTTAPIILNASRVQDIDTLTDWKLAELKFTISE